MKKLLFLFPLLSCTLGALPMGNPAQASLLYDGLFLDGYYFDPCDEFCDAFSLRAGFYGDFVHDRRFEIKQTDTEIPGNGSLVENSRIWTAGAIASFNLWNRIDIFATVGTSTFDFNSNGTLFSDAFSGERADLRLRPAFSWSIGSRATLFEYGCFAVGIEGQFFFWDSNVEKIRLASLTTLYPDIRVRMREWQVGLGLARKIRSLVPYVAVKYSRATLHFDPFEFSVAGSSGRLHDLRNRAHFGLAVGTSFISFRKVSLTVEGRFFDEEALYVNAEIRF